MRCSSGNLGRRVPCPLQKSKIKCWARKCEWPVSRAMYCVALAFPGLAPKASAANMYCRHKNLSSYFFIRHAYYCICTFILSFGSDRTRQGLLSHHTTVALIERLRREILKCPSTGVYCRPVSGVLVAVAVAVDRVDPRPPVDPLGRKTLDLHRRRRPG